MESREQQILSEIKSMMASVRAQLEQLDAKIALWQQYVDTEEDPDEPIDLNIDDLPFDMSFVQEENVVPEQEAEVVEQSESLLFFDPEEQPSAQEAPKTPPASTQTQEQSVPGSVIDVLQEKQPWRTDMPGTYVKDIRLAISINERVLFINRLFSEDAVLFQTTINAINTMDTLDEVVDYVMREFPQWDMGSDTVYRFMMAARRRVK